VSQKESEQRNFLHLSIT